MAGEEEAKLNIGRENKEECLFGGVAFLYCQSWLSCLQPFLLDEREDLLDLEYEIKGTNYKE